MGIKTYIDPSRKRHRKFRPAYMKNLRWNIKVFGYYVRRKNNIKFICYKGKKNYFYQAETLPLNGFADEHEKQIYKSWVHNKYFSSVPKMLKDQDIFEFSKTNNQMSF